jgi:hypothetical protein
LPDLQATSLILALNRSSTVSTLSTSPFQFLAVVHENSATCGCAGLVCALHYREWEEAMLKISFIDVIREDPILNFDWRHGTATVPVNFGFGRVFKIGLRPINAYAQPQWTFVGRTMRGMSSLDSRCGLTSTCSIQRNPDEAATEI